MWWPFKKKIPKPEPGEIVSEHWETMFSGKGEVRFEEETGEGYTAVPEKGRLSLSLERKNLFAWSICRMYRYRNLVLDMDVSFFSENGYSAAGAVLRYADDSTYYYVMVSNTGFFRFDVVFNGTPRTLIPWTSFSEDKIEGFTLTSVIHGTFFAFFINGVWVGEVDDETLDAGYFGFAGQNYGERDRAAFFLERVAVESNDLEIEEFYDTNVKGDTVPPENRKRLASRFFDTGQYQAALIQLEKALKREEPSVGDHILKARIYNFLGLKDDALAEIEKCFPLSVSKEDVILEKAGILYRMNRFLEVKTFLEDTSGIWENNPVVWDLLGNAKDSLGDFSGAFDCYAKAAELDPGNGIFLLNGARSLEKTGDKDRALDHYRRAASAFFETENYTDLNYVITCMNRIAPGNPYSEMYEGKLLFQEGNLDRAFDMFRGLRESGSGDSSTDFLYALILAGRGERERADGIFAEVVEKEPEYYLYWFRYAENLYFLGKDTSYAMKKTLELGKDDPWVLNLAGLIAMEGGRVNDALEYYQDAMAKDDAISEIRINLSDALFAAGRSGEAYSLLEGDDDAGIVNQRGNLLTREGRYDEAARYYYKAVKLEPSSRVYRLNYVDVLLKLDRILEAEEILSGLLEEGADPGALVKMASIAVLRGEYRRAEAAFQEALKMDPSLDDVKLEYADFLVMRHDYKRADELLDRLSEGYETERAGRLRNVILDATTEEFSCSKCGRKWRVPKVIPEVRRLVLKGEPDPASPAGKCPSCGKIYCVECVMEYISGSRFTCMDCGEPLKLSENYLRYLASEYAKNLKE